MSGTVIRGYATKADVRAETPPAGDPGLVLLMVVENGFLYRWVLSSTAADDDSVTLAPNNPPTPTGRWVAQTSGEIADVLAALAANTSPVAFNGQRLTGVANPSGAQDAATKASSEAVVTATRVLAALAAVATPVAINGQKITGLAAPTATPGGLDVAAKGSSGEAALSDHVHPDTGIKRVMVMTLAHAATLDSTALLKSTEYVFNVRLKVTTPYSANATLDVGQAGHTTDFVNHSAAGADPALSDLSLLAAGDTIDIRGITAVAADATALRVSIGGSPAAGAGLLLVEYGVPTS